MSPELKGWLNQVVYPRLTHDQVFGSLPGYTKAEHSETRYADCPRCHHAKAFYMPADRPVGNCNHCYITITWWSYLRFDHTEIDTIAQIAAFAGVEPLATAPPADPIFRA
jgi:hypothetical protein